MNRRSARIKLIPLVFLSIGVFLLMQILMPIISFQLWVLGQKFDNGVLISPNNTEKNQVLGISIQNNDNFPSFISFLKRESKPSYSHFYMTIPKLKIDKERVGVDSNDLSKALAHLPGSALPGEKGNAFISGHSALSALFSLKSAAFASLPNIKKGDEINIEAGGINYKYEVTQIKIVDPKDISVINPPDSQGRFITLMTCVPPGLNFKRMIVLGKMI